MKCTARAPSQVRTFLALMARVLLPVRVNGCWLDATSAEEAMQSLLARSNVPVSKRLSAIVEGLGIMKDMQPGEDVIVGCTWAGKDLVSRSHPDHVKYFASLVIASQRTQASLLVVIYDFLSRCKEMNAPRNFSWTTVEPRERLDAWENKSRRAARLGYGAWALRSKRHPSDPVEVKTLAKRSRCLHPVREYGAFVELPAFHYKCRFSMSSWIRTRTEPPDYYQWGE